MVCRADKADSACECDLNQCCPYCDSLDQILNIMPQVLNELRILLDHANEQGSEYGYPKRLEELGFSLQDIDRLIIAGEVPKEEMLDMFKNDWCMGKRLGSVELPMHSNSFEARAAQSWLR